MKQTSGKKSKTKVAAAGVTTMPGLYKWNLWLASIHAVQGLAILLLSSTRTIPMTTNYLTVDSLASSAAGHPVLAVATRQLLEVNLACLVAIFFFVSAIAHGLAASWYRKRYEADVRQGLNKVRWIEYGLSASTMLVAVGLLSGVYDVSSLLMIFVLGLIMNLLGLAMEVYNQGRAKTNWLSYGIGCLAGIAPWIVFAVYLAGASLYGNGGIPAFVYGIYASIFLLYASFAGNMYLQYKKIGKWANYLYGERVYMMLSLVAKTALAWQIFAGTLRP